MEEKNMALPQDPFLLVSVLNTYLRDFYSDLDELCEDKELDKAEICEKLQKVGFSYNAEQNEFKR